MSHQESIPPEQQQQPGKDLDAKIPDPEVVPRAKRRQFTTEYKLRILEEADCCTEPGQIGALLRREGLYSSHLSKWRKLRARWQREALAPQKRGRPPQDPTAAELAQLRRENERLRAQLEQAELIIDVQKKLAQLLGLGTDETHNNERTS
jgi:transposase-like protein